MPLGANAGNSDAAPIAELAELLSVEDSAEDGIHVAQLQLRVYHRTDLLIVKNPVDIRVILEDLQEILIFIPDLHGAPLDPGIGLFTRNALAHEVQKELPRKSQPARQLHVLQHTFRVDDQSVNDPRHGAQHVTEDS